MTSIHFESHYEAFMQHHLQSRSGERLRRLQEGHQHADEKLFLEQLWWPAMGHFEHLHPEYEVYDFKDGKRYLDFAYIRPPFQICFEIDGYGPHNRDVSRWQFADQLMRQNYLVVDGWKVIRFAYDDINEKPRRCQQIIQQFMGRWYGDEQSPVALTFQQKEIVRLAIHRQRPITPKDVRERLDVGDRHARTLLKQLLQQNILSPATGGTQRIHGYQLGVLGKQFHL